MITIPALLLSVVSGSVEAEDYAELTRRRLSCGLNAIYIMGRLQGVDVKYNDIARAVPLSEHGASLLHLKEAGIELGMPCRVQKYSLQELLDAPTPFVAHFHKSASDISNGHFVVVTSVSRNGIELIDGTTGQRATFGFERFPVFWSGYVLEPRRDTALDAVNVSQVAICLVLSVVLVMLVWPTRSPWWPVSCVLLLLLSATQGEAVGSAVDQSWRSGANDGRNSLYVLAQSIGKDVAYGQLTSFISVPSSMRELQEGAVEVGITLRAERCGPRQLADMPMPAIVHLRDYRTGEANFALVYRVRELGVGVFDGSSSTISELSIDEFRRRWSGIALVRGEPRSYWIAFLGAAVLAAVFVFGSRARKKQQNGIACQPPTKESLGCSQIT